MTLPPILLAEDDPRDLELTLLALARQGLADRVAVVPDGLALVDRLQDSEPPALILMDLKMPRMDGLEALRRIKADPRHARIPVVVFSSSMQTRDRQACEAAGAAAFVVKPLEVEAYLGTVQEVTAGLLG